MMRTVAAVLCGWMLAALALALIVPAQVVAAPEFSNLMVSVSQAGLLEVTFVIAGLPAGDVTTVRAEVSDVSASYACAGARGAIARGARSSTETRTLIIGSAQVAVNAAGFAFDTVAVAPPPPSLLCAPGEKPALVSVSFGDIALRTSTGVTASVPGSFNRIFIESMILLAGPAPVA